MSATTTTTTGVPTTTDRATLLVRSVRIDALMSGVSGVLLAVGAPFLDGVLGAPVEFLVAVGVFLLGYAAALVLLANAGAPAAGVKLVIAGNALWVIASLAAVVADWLTLTAAGTAVALALAAAVALVAELQFVGLRRLG